jgi:hypothetical protein
MPASQRVVQVCLFIAAAIGLFGGALQMYLGQPETTPRLDNIHRFLAGIYLGGGLLALWTALKIRRHSTLIYFLALMVLFGGLGRLVSMSQVGLPQPAALWLGYLTPELILPIVMMLAQRMTDRGAVRAA